jgi:hypothetical protein
MTEEVEVVESPVEVTEVTIGEQEADTEQEQEEAPVWVKELRKSHRESQKENRRLQKELEALKAPKPVEHKPLRNKPRLEDHDYDAEVFEQDLEKWFSEKRDADRKAKEIEDAKTAEKEAWNQKLAAYTDHRGKLEVEDFEDAEQEIQETLSQVQQGIILQGADNPALLVYALGKNPAKAQELAKLSDPVKFAFAVAKLEKELKVTSKKSAPPPETKVESGSAAKGSSTEKHLERLREEAAKTGDYTKVTAYKRSLKK